MSVARFVEVFDFQGKYFERTSATGHVALKHGHYYYSYGGGTILYNNEKSQNSESDAYLTREESENQIALKKDQLYYGKYSQIILPIPCTKGKSIETLRANFTDWTAQNYSIVKQNCVDLVKLYLSKLGYAPKKHGFISTLRPHRYANELRELGKNIIKQIIQDINNQLEDNKLENTEVKNKNDELGLGDWGNQKKVELKNFKISNEFRNKLNKLNKVNSSLKEFTDLKDRDISQYCQLLQIIAQKHYDMEEPRDLYSDLFREALNICPKFNSFEYQANPKNPAKDYFKDLGLGISAFFLTVISPLIFLASPVIRFGEYLIELAIKPKQEKDENTSFWQTHSEDLKKFAKYTGYGFLITAIIAAAIFTGGAVLAAAGGAGLVASLTSGLSATTLGFGINIFSYAATSIWLWLSLSFYSSHKLSSPSKIMREQSPPESLPEEEKVSDTSKYISENKEEPQMPYLDSHSQVTSILADNPSTPTSQNVSITPVDLSPETQPSNTTPDLSAESHSFSATPQEQDPKPDDALLKKKFTS